MNGMRVSHRILMGLIYEGTISPEEMFAYVLGQAPLARRLRMQTTALMLRYRVP